MTPDGMPRKGPEPKPPLARQPLEPAASSSPEASAHAAAPEAASEPAASPTPESKEEEVVLFALDNQEELYRPLAADQPGIRANWVITFADLMNLLLCCFILLYASSRLDLERFRLIAQSMSGALTGKEVIYVPMPSEEAQKIIASQKETDMTARLRRTLAGANQIRLALATEIAQKQLEVEVSGELIIIRILQSGSFEVGSSTLNQNFLPIAKKIREALVNVPGDITVAGHADNQPIGGGAFLSNWELSGARACSMIHELIKGGVLPESRFVLKGFGDTQPRVPNTSQVNREQNRRVEIIIDQRGLGEPPEGPILPAW